MMGAPVRRDKDAVFKHKRVAETKGRSAICGPPGIHQQRMPLASLTNLSRRMSTISKQAIQLRAEVPFDLGGQRLDQVAAQLFSEHSRSRLAAWIKDGLLTVDGAVLRPRDTVHAGAVLELSAEQQAQGEWVAQDIPLDIVYEDDQILVIDKPAGLVVHPAAGHADGTLLNALLHHVPDLINVPRAGIVHRLDKDTTGLMVVAKTLQAQTRLVEQLQARSVSRIYEAIVIGVIITGGTVDAPIGRHGQQRQRMAVVEGQARGQSLSCARALPLAHPCAGQAGNRAYPPDSCAHDPPRLPAGGRSAVCRAFPYSASCQSDTGADAARVPTAGAACPFPRAGSSGDRAAHEVGVAIAGRLRLAADAPATGSRGLRRVTVGNENWLLPDWPAPARVRACVTTRQGCQRGSVRQFQSRRSCRR